MKKILVSVLVLLSMLTMFVGTVAAAPKMSVTFQGGIWTGHGVNFTFKVDESLGGGWLTATISWDGGGANMSCVQEGDIVTCTGPKTAADKNIVVSFQGLSYSTYVKSHSFCYGIWDYWGFTNGEWENFGPYCQDTAAHQGDMIMYTVPDPNGSFEFPSWFLEDANCEWFDVPDQGPAYYFCPF